MGIFNSEKLERVDGVCKLPKTFTENYTKWTLLERWENRVFLEGESTSGGPKRWESACVVVDGEIEKVRTAMNWDKDPSSLCWNKEKMYQVYLNHIEQIKEDRERKKLAAEEQKAKVRAESDWIDSLNAAREYQNSLIIELKTLRRLSGDPKVFINNKKVVSILDALARIEMYRHHSK